MSRAYSSIPGDDQDQCVNSLRFKEDGRLFIWPTQRVIIGRSLLSHQKLPLDARGIDDLCDAWPNHKRRYTKAMDEIDLHTFFGPARVLDPYKAEIIADIYETLLQACKSQGRFWDFLIGHLDWVQHPNFYIIDGELFDYKSRPLEWTTELPTVSREVDPGRDNKQLTDRLEGFEEQLRSLALSPSSTASAGSSRRDQDSPPRSASRRASGYSSSSRISAPLQVTPSRRATSPSSSSRRTPARDTHSTPTPRGSRYTEDDFYGSSSRRGAGNTPSYQRRSATPSSSRRIRYDDE